MSYLDILKASAGSGKTFSMARLYLKLILQDEQYFKHILAVTFTNKATSELKERVLNELNKLASGNKSAHLRYLSNVLQLKGAQVCQKARKVLQRLLQDYSNFHIYTIDGFFQYILKGFFREIGLHNQYSIELNQDQILDKATDLVFYELAESGDSELVKWLTRFWETEVEDGHGWNLKNRIKELGKELFSEQYKFFSEKGEKLDEVLGEISGIQQKIGTRKKQFDAKVAEISYSAIKAIENSGLQTDDFKGKSRSVVSVFKKVYEVQDNFGIKNLPKFEKFVDNPNEVVPAKGDNRMAVESLYHSTLNKALKDLQQQYQEEFPVVVRDKLIKKHLYSLGVIKYVQAAIKKLNAEQNTILISDSNDLIAQIIKHSDAPFIYEKSGNKFWHYMIDEFQDTSRMQWGNLKPLVENSMAYGKNNLIVGDVKQSIYRWRNSDWKMLGGDILKEFTQQSVTENNLPANYRSKAEIIDFNNAFFARSGMLLFNEWKNDENENAWLIEKAYENIYQEKGSKKQGGFVTANLVNAEKKDEAKQLALEKLPEQISELLQKGYQQSELCILVRTNAEGKEIIDFCQKKFEGEQVQFVSEESFYLKSSYVVNFVISFLKYMKQPTKLVFNDLYFLLRSHFSGSNISIQSPMQLQNSLDEFTQNASNKALVHIIHDVVLAFNLDKQEGQMPYLLALFDEMKALQERGHGGIEAFLKFWDTHGEKLVLRDAQNKNAIRVLSIHKSKGLEFDVVLIPFAHWEFYPNPQTAPYLWCENNFFKAENLKVLPVKYEQSMQYTAFEGVYNLERVQSGIDSINLLYVAFTRAKEGLVFNFFEMKKDRSGNGLTNTSKLISEVFDQSVGETASLVDLSKYWDDEKKSFQLGSIPQKERSTQKAEKRKYELHFASPESKISIRKKVRSAQNKFTADASGQGISKVRMGVMLHAFFENLQSLSQVETDLEELVTQNGLNKSDYENIRKLILKQVKKPQIARWFADESRVLKEISVLTPGGELLRPDRVVETLFGIDVIDYKFGRVKSDMHVNQVKHYVQTLENMFDKPVQGFVWYVMLGKVEAV